MSTKDPVLPNIDAVENKAAKLFRDLRLFENQSYYVPTKRRLLAVKEVLQSCINLIDVVVAAPSSRTPSLPSSPLPEAMNSQTVDPLPSPKRDVREYRNRLQNLPDTGIVQVNQVATQLSRWYCARFTPSHRNSDFHFRSEKIGEWIDSFLLAAGYALHTDSMSKFVSEIESWVQQIEEDPSMLWPMPPIVANAYRDLNIYCTKEAILLELVIKPRIYDASFYSERLHTITKIVTDNMLINNSELTVLGLLKSCPNFIPTSAFEHYYYN